MNAGDTVFEMIATLIKVVIDDGSSMVPLAPQDLNT